MTDGGVHGYHIRAGNLDDRVHFWHASHCCGQAGHRPSARLAARHWRQSYQLADQFTTFAAHFTVVSWDARGYGHSDGYDGPLNPIDFSHDLKRLLDSYGVQKAHIAGLSMGGMIAQDFYSLYPERVATLVLCDTSDGLNTRMTPEQREEFIRLRLGPLLAGQEPKDMAPTVADTLIGRQSSRAAWQRLVDSMAALHKESYIKTVRANTARTDYPDAGQIRVPTLLVFGEDDRLTCRHRPRHAGEDPRRKLVIIPTAGD